VSDHLFDITVYGGPERQRRRRSARPREVRLQRPWVLLGTARSEPKAHLLVLNAAPNKNGGWRTRCGRVGYRIEIEGHPMALVCATCWDIAR
jgi:hypothetical protein